MPLVLALEPDPRQAEALTPIVDQVGAELVVAASTDVAMRALGGRVPNLVLLSALLPPADESAINDYLRARADAACIETLTIPLLASADDGRTAKRGFWAGLRKSRTSDPTLGCQPEVFAEQIRAYLERACEMRAALANRIPADAHTDARPSTEETTLAPGLAGGSAAYAPTSDEQHALSPAGWQQARVAE